MEKNLYKTCQHLERNVLRWLKDEDKIRKNKNGNGAFPEMKEQLHQKFRELRRRGVPVESWWLLSRAKQILG